MEQITEWMEFTTYPFNIFGGGFEKVTLAVEQLPFKGDTVIVNDVRIGRPLLCQGARLVKVQLLY